MSIESPDDLLSSSSFRCFSESIANFSSGEGDGIGGSFAFAESIAFLIMEDSTFVELRNVWTFGDRICLGGGAKSASATFGI